MLARASRVTFKRAAVPTGRPIEEEPYQVAYTVNSKIKKSASFRGLVQYSPTDRRFFPPMHCQYAAITMPLLMNLERLCPEGMPKPYRLQASFTMHIRSSGSSAALIKSIDAEGSVLYSRTEYKRRCVVPSRETCLSTSTKHGV